MARVKESMKTTYQFMLLAPLTLAMGAYMLCARKNIFQQFL